MKLVQAAVIGLSTSLVLGCAQDRTPLSPELPAAAPAQPAPPPAPPGPPLQPLTPGPGHIWVSILGPSGACIPGATLQTVTTEGVGAPIVQETPCDAWSYSPGVYMNNLSPDVNLRLRASAAGFDSRELTVRPTRYGDITAAGYILFHLTPVK